MSFEHCQSVVLLCIVSYTSHGLGAHAVLLYLIVLAKK